ncbi:MAG TPA: hypothetical protein VFZ66_03045 [Herpetosiphonaceae bacterium]
MILLLLDRRCVSNPAAMTAILNQPQMAARPVILRPGARYSASLQEISTPPARR